MGFIKDRNQGRNGIFIIYGSLKVNAKSKRKYRILACETSDIHVC
jgi:hypothetical protein